MTYGFLVAKGKSFRRGGVLETQKGLCDKSGGFTREEKNGKGGLSSEKKGILEV